MKHYARLRRIASSLVIIFISLGLFGICRHVFLGLSMLQFGQIFVSLSGGAAVVCLVTLLFSFLFGRVYCSVLCPLGVFQDIAGALRGFLTGRKYAYRGRLKWLRCLLFIAVAALFITGMPYLAGLLDPYSVYVRGASTALDHAVGTVTELAAPVLRDFGIYPTYSPGEFALMPVLTLAVIFLAAFFRGRIFCNTICPAGMILGCASQAPVVRPAFNERCVSCGRCEAVCKSECINARDRYIDSSRCVMCGNCAEACPVSAIKFSARDIWRVQHDPERRGVLAGAASAALFMALPFVKLGEFIFPKWAAEGGPAPQVPAGAMSWARLLDKCVGCHACIKSCPSKALAPAGMRARGIQGIAGAMKPVLDFTNGFCQYDCVECGRACPFSAILTIDTEEKHRTQTGIARYEKELCVIVTNGESCGACAEHCPTGALEIPSSADGAAEAPVPVIDPKLCVGCGACEYMCPVIPRKAIVVEPLAVHQSADVLEFQDSNLDEEDEGFKF